MVAVLKQNMGQTRSNVVNEVKKQALALVFFFFFLGKYLLKQTVVVVKPSEWKFIAIIARTAKFKGH